MASSERSPPQIPKKLQQEEEDDEVLWSEECKQLLLCLPRQQGWGNWPYLYHFQGFWFTSRQLQGTLNCLSHFQSLPSDVLLVTFPKSGTTWLKSLLFCIVNRHVHPVNATSNHPLTTHNPHDLVPFMERNLYVQEEDNHHSQGSSIKLLSTHVPVTCLPSSVTDSGCKVVYLWRDPRDTFVSLWHFINTGCGGGPAAPLDEVFDKFCDGVSVYGPMWDHVLGYWRESLKRPSRVLFLKFEDLKADPEVGVKRVAEFLGCPFKEDEDGGGGVVDRIVGMCSFGHLSNLDVNRNGRQNARWPNKAFFRRGEVGDWANYLTPEMSDRLMKIVDGKLHGCGLILDN